MANMRIGFIAIVALSLSAGLLAQGIAPGPGGGVPVPVKAGNCHLSVHLSHVQQEVGGGRGDDASIIIHGEIHQHDDDSGSFGVEQVGCRFTLKARRPPFGLPAARFAVFAVYTPPLTWSENRGRQFTFKEGDITVKKIKDALAHGERMFPFDLDPGSLRLEMFAVAADMEGCTATSTLAYEWQHLLEGAMEHGLAHPPEINLSPGCGLTLSILHGSVVSFQTVHDLLNPRFDITMVATINTKDGNECLGSEVVTQFTSFVFNYRELDGGIAQGVVLIQPRPNYMQLPEETKPTEITTYVGAHDFTFNEQTRLLDTQVFSSFQDATIQALPEGTSTVELARRLLKANALAVGVSAEVIDSNDNDAEADTLLVP